MNKATALLFFIIGLCQNQAQAQYYYAEYVVSVPVNINLKESENANKELLASIQNFMPTQSQSIVKTYIDVNSKKMRWMTQSDTGSTSEVGSLKIRIQTTPKDYLILTKDWTIVNLLEEDSCRTVRELSYQVLEGEKKIQGYSCLAAQVLSEEGLKSHKIWYCPDLPSEISPKLRIKGIKGAVLEVEGADGLRVSLNKLDTKAKAEVKKMTKLNPKPCTILSQGFYLYGEYRDRPKL